MAAMFHNQGNPVFDYVWNQCAVALVVVCMREMMVLNHSPVGTSGLLGILFTRSGSWPKHSEFVDFFATYKATLPAIGV